MIAVTTGWIGTGTKADPYRPAVVDEHGLKNWSDQTGADPKKGGGFVVHVSDTKATEAAVKADPKYAGKVVDVLPSPVDGVVISAVKGGGS